MITDTPSSIGQKPRVLLIDDEDGFVFNLTLRLESEGFEVHAEKFLHTGLKQLENTYDLILLDWGLPDGEGITFLKEHQEVKHKAPVILLTANGDIDSKTEAFHFGAWDYITKPFDLDEMILRVRSVMRRTLKKKPKVVRSGTVEYIIDDDVLLLDGKEAQLTRKSKALAVFFLLNQDRVIPRDVILDKVWGENAFPTHRTVDSHVKLIRKELGLESLVSIYGVGYKLRSDFRI